MLSKNILIDGSSFSVHFNTKDEVRLTELPTQEDSTERLLTLLEVKAKVSRVDVEDLKSIPDGSVELLDDRYNKFVYIPKEIIDELDGLEFISKMDAYTFLGLDVIHYENIDPDCDEEETAATFDQLKEEYGEDYCRQFLGAYIVVAPYRN